AQPLLGAGAGRGLVTHRCAQRAVPRTLLHLSDPAADIAPLRRLPKRLSDRVAQPTQRASHRRLLPSLRPVGHHDLAFYPSLNPEAREGNVPASMVQASTVRARPAPIAARLAPRVMATKSAETGAQPPKRSCTSPTARGPKTAPST